MRPKESDSSGLWTALAGEDKDVEDCRGTTPPRQFTSRLTHADGIIAAEMGETDGKTSSTGDHPTDKGVKAPEKKPGEDK